MEYISKNILSENYFIYIKFYFKNYYNFDIKEGYKILSLLDPYLYINKDYVARFYENFKFVKTKYKLHKIKDLLINSNISILQYQPFISYFFQTYEEIIKFKLINKNKSNSILEITNLPNVFEACYYYEKNKKNNINRSSYTVDLFTNYSNKIFLDKKEEYLEYYNQYIKNIKINEITTYFTDNMFKNITYTYDLIFTNIKYNQDFINISMEDISNLNLYIYQLYYALLRLNMGGDLVFPALQIRNKKMADLILLISSYFTSYELYTPEIHNKYKLSTVLVIYKTLIINKFDKLKEIFYKLYNEDNTGIEFKFGRNINDFNYDKKYLIPQEYINNNYKYVDSLLDTDVDNPIYDKIKAYNKKIYFLKSLYLETINNYVNMNEKDKEEYIKNLKKEQLINALFYAKKWGFKTIPFEKGFNKDFDNLILKDIFNYNNGYSYNFIKSKNNKFIEFDRKKIKKLNKELEMSDYIINTTDNFDINKKTNNLFLNLINVNTKNKSFEKLIEKEFNQRNITTDWLKMYEVINLFNLIKINKSINSNIYKTFHLCEAPGNFISAINHYLKTETSIKNYDWYAQTLNPNKELYNFTSFKDDFNYIKKYSDRWKFGYNNIGDITDPENIRWYREFTLDRNVELITSDCGIREEDNLEYIIKLHCAQLIFVLYNLPKKGNCLIKLNLPFLYTFQLELLYKYYISFDKLYIYKGNQNPLSKEFYLIGIGYNRNILEKELDNLLEQYINYDSEKDKERKFLEDFIKQIYFIYETLINNYLFYFERKLFYINNHKNINKEHLKLLTESINKKNNLWIEKNNIKPIKDEDKL
jgi:hypothetical protein